MNLFTITLNISFRSFAFANSASVAYGSLPAKIGRSYFFANSFVVPKIPGLQNDTML